MDVLAAHQASIELRFCLRVDDFVCGKRLVVEGVEILDKAVNCLGIVALEVEYPVFVDLSVGLVDLLGYVQPKASMWWLLTSLPSSPDSFLKKSDLGQTIALCAWYVL